MMFAIEFMNIETYISVIFMRTGLREATIITPSNCSEILLLNLLSNFLYTFSIFKDWFDNYVMLCFSSQARLINISTALFNGTFVKRETTSNEINTQPS